MCTLIKHLIHNQIVNVSVPTLYMDKFKELDNGADRECKFKLKMG